MLAYHELSTHELMRPAPGPGWLDWEHQPDPFRRYAGAETVALMREPGLDATPYDDAAQLGARAPVPVTAESLARLFLDALALSAWKELDDARWALRVNPSSGNLHPTEAYFVGGAVEGLFDTPVVAHYAAKEHALEVRARPDAALGSALQGELPAGSFLVGFTSIPWRESWKYGERAYRYCQHDLGHALACVSLAAGALGWRTRLLDGLATHEVARWLGVDRDEDFNDAEREEAEALLVLVPNADFDSVDGWAPSRDALEAWSALEWHGRANALSSEHVSWGGLETAFSVCAKPRTPVSTSTNRASASIPPAGCTAPFSTIARARRSAVAFDGRTEIDRDAFARMLLATMPLPGRRPFDALPWKPSIHLVLFVHRVRGVEPGLLLLARGADALARIQGEFAAQFTRTPEAWAPPELPLIRLASGDLRATARGLSCQQEIASDGCFAVAMLAELGDALEQEGPWVYPRLHWEAGAVGQVLYLEAEASGVRATGIGCFFDHETHRALGLTSPRLRDLYHFTVGGAVDDPRLTTLPAYPG